MKRIFVESRRSVDYLSEFEGTSSSSAASTKSSDVERDSADTDDLSTEQSGSEIENGDTEAAEITGQPGPDFEPYQLRPRKRSGHAGIGSPVAKRTRLDNGSRGRGQQGSGRGQGSSGGGRGGGRGSLGQGKGRGRG